MAKSLSRHAGAARSRYQLEAFEPRTLMDASYTYIDHGVADLPSDHLGAGGANAAPVILDDLDGDGIKDLAASGSHGSGTSATGFVGIYNGATGSLLREVFSASGLTSDAKADFGYTFALVGDMDGDGHTDLAVDEGVTTAGAGRILFFSTGTGFTLNQIHYSVPGWAVEYRTHLFSPGDVNGDGAGDLIMARPMSSDALAGGVALVRGYSIGTLSKLWESPLEDNLISKPDVNDYRGFASVGDINADGVPDMLLSGNVRRPDQCSARIYLLSGADGSQIRTWRNAESFEPDSRVNQSIVFLGDIDHDGTGEFAYVATSFKYTAGHSTENAKLVVQSLDSADLETPKWSVDLGKWTSLESRTGEFLRFGFANIGDFNGDSIADIGVMRNPASSNDPLRPESSLRLISGVDGSTLTEITTTTVRPDHSRTTGVVDYGVSLAAADLNADGFVDLIVGASMAPSPTEGQPNPAPFLAVLPTLRLHTPTFTAIRETAIGMIDGVQFVTINQVITPVTALPGWVSSDTLLDYSTSGIALGAAHPDGTGAFLLTNGVRTELDSLPTVDRYSTEGGFTAKPAGTCGSVMAVASTTAGYGAVKILRDGAVSTTWLLRPNAADTGYELVYLFDGDPSGIESDGVAANSNDGTSALLADLGSSPRLITVDGFHATYAQGLYLGGFTPDGKTALVANFSIRPPLDTGLFYGVMTLLTSTTPISTSLQFISIVVNNIVTFQPTQPADLRINSWSLPAKSITWVATPVTKDSILGLPANVTSFEQTPYPGNRFSLLTVSINGAAPTAARYVTKDETSATFLFDPNQPMTTTPVGTSGTAMVGLSPFGELLYIRRESSNDDWQFDAMPTAGGPLIPNGTVIHGISAWENGIALATDQGLLRLIRRQRGSWSLLNLTENISGATTITRGLTLIQSLDNYIILAGINADGQVVLYGSNTPAPDRTTTWNYDNLYTSVLAPFNIPDPQLQGDLIAYVTPWNGLNVAGVNAAGEPVTFWSAPGVSGWRFSNLADAQADPSVARGFTRLAVNVTPWGGISITDADATLRTVWWAPVLGGAWKYATLVDAATNSPHPVLSSASVVGFTTPWGGQNLIGTDADGHLWVYWWSLESNQWAATSLQDQAPGLDARVFTPRTAAYATATELAMAVTAVDTSGYLVQMEFQIGDGWAFVVPNANF